MALTLDGTTGISATGNIYGNNIIVTNSLTAGSFSPALLSSTGNVTGGNLLTGGLISATGNITGAYILGNGSQLTGVDATQIVNGTSNAKVVSSGGNIAVGIGGTSNVTVFATTGAYVTGLVSATGTITGTSHLGAVVSVTGNVTGGNILTGGVVSATGNINANFFIGNGSQLSGLSASKIFNGTSEANIGASGGNANITIGGTSNVFVVATTGIYTTGLSSVSGNVTAANIIINGTAAAGSGVLIVSGNIQTSTSNATSNIGNASNYFNRLFAQATTALYADLAEIYKADAQYPPGTVVVFGGTQEVTMSTVTHDNKIAGVVSTHPAHVMNSGLQSEFTVEVGLIGRVPCRVIGPIEAGDRVVSSNRAGVAERLDMSQYQPGVIIGKALQSYSSTDVGTIEVVVGRL